ncbi:MAG TPA: Gfo/Idh/MocA family oxidoreductase [Rariglobus sp.]|jgi:predicted dehydrogenase|nr:Gfo/Idh/MocA family oxidoreductase [Rariglobus sp.]
MPHAIDRRSFLKLAATATGAIWVGARPLLAGGASDTIRIGVAGVRGKGWAHVTQLLQMKDVRIVALCDVDSKILGGRIAQLEKAGVKAAAHNDFRRMLEMKNLDAVVIATPNHHHTLQTIWACQAGKDVYVEKPVCHNLFEGLQIARAAEKYGRVVQGGTQKRSDQGHIEGFDFIKKGGLGKIRLVRGLCYRFRPSIGKVDGPQPIPASVDYNLWCGPAPMAPLMRKNLHYDWHWDWSTGNGEIGNQGPHELDLARWVLGENGLPRRVISVGARLGLDDDGQTPNTQLVLYDYPAAPLLFEVRGLPMALGENETDSYRQLRVGVIVECENGSFVAGDSGGWIHDLQGKKVRRFTGDAGARHMRNFIDAVRAQRPQDLHAPVHETAISNGLTHMANLSHRVGAFASPEAIREKLSAHHDATEAFGRILTNLDVNKIDLKKTPLTLGGWLEWNDARQSFSDGAGFEHANQLITRDYREEFIVPTIG